MGWTNLERNLNKISLRNVSVGAAEGSKTRTLTGTIRNILTYHSIRHFELCSLTFHSKPTSTKQFLNKKKPQSKTSNTAPEKKKSLTVFLVYLYKWFEALLGPCQTVLTLWTHLGGAELDTGLPLHQSGRNLHYDGLHCVGAWPTLLGQQLHANSSSHQDITTWEEKIITISNHARKKTILKSGPTLVHELNSFLKVVCKPQLFFSSEFNNGDKFITQKTNATLRRSNLDENLIYFSCTFMVVEKQNVTVWK